MDRVRNAFIGIGPSCGGNWIDLFEKTQHFQLFFLKFKIGPSWEMNRVGEPELVTEPDRIVSLHDSTADTAPEPCIWCF